MSKVDKNAFSFLYDGKILKSEDLIADRELLANAIDDNQTQIAYIMFGSNRVNIFDTKALLDSYNALLEGEYAIVLVDETVSDKMNLYKKTSGIVALEAEDFYVANLFTVFENRVLEGFTDTIIENSAVNIVPLTVDAVASTSVHLQDWTVDGVQKAFISPYGEIIADRFADISDNTYYLDPGYTGISMNVAGAVVIAKDLTVHGDITQHGENYIVDAITVQISDNIIELAKDNTLALIGYAGLAIRNYDGVNDGGIIIDSAGEFRVGDVIIELDGSVSDNGSLPLLARDEILNLNDGEILAWDATNLKAIGLTIDYFIQIASTEEAIEGTDNEKIITPLRLAEAGGTFDSYGALIDGGLLTETPTETVDGGLLTSYTAEDVAYGGKLTD